MILSVFQTEGFATNDSIQILVMNIDAFAKDQNIDIELTTGELMVKALLSSFNLQIQ